MNFIDHAKVIVQAASGGNGHVSFRRERYISKGGPDGGDGGDGGDVILKASNSQSSLAAFRHTKKLVSEPGQPGGNKKKHGKSGKDLIVAVPVGTEVKTPEGKILADLIEDGQECVIALGGKGGFGNAHFISSRRQTPNFAEKGEPGESFDLVFELKMLADVGLVGLPNAGKSTLLASVSNARPKIANYPFTTLNPSVGVVDVGDDSILFADIPGLIEGAAEGKGLGHDFLRHIERTSVIVHLIDIYSDDIKRDYLTVRKELASYNKSLAERPEIIALNKTEGTDKKRGDVAKQALLDSVKGKKKPQIFLISAKSREGLKDLEFAAYKQVIAARSAVQKAKADEVYEYVLPDNQRTWQIEKVRNGVYRVIGKHIERFAQRTDFSNDQAVARLLDILKRRGIINALVRKGIQPGDKIKIGESGEIIY